MSEIEPKIDSNYYGKQISIIDKEIASIKASLPNNEEIELLEKISQIESKSIDNNSNKLNSKIFIHGISELFKEDRQVDLLLNWQMHQAKLEEYKLGKVKSDYQKGKEFEYDNRNIRQNNLQSQQHQRLERLNFNDVSKALSASDYESIFRRYAQVINPDGKIVKRGSSIGCGSLNMNLQNGLWNRFSTGDSGNIFGLVSIGMKVNKLEALEIVAEHAGIRPEGSGYFRIRNTHERYNRAIENNEYSVKKELRDDWLQTNTRGAKAFEPDNDLKFMLKSNKITDIYEYKNIYSETLGYTVRMEDIKTHKKQVLPVTYCYNEKLNKSRWQLKGFTVANTKPIYGIEKLAKHPEKPVLIVEGEKTANKAQELLPGHNVISWMGGVGSVDKVDWSKLASKSVVIWPDNDKPGIDAANNIANHVDCHNGYSGLVSIVDTEKLTLPEKWDLADNVPGTSKLANVGINCAIEKTMIDNRTISNKLEMSQEMSKYSGKGNKVLGSIAMLVETGTISKDEYVSKAIYFNTITSISDSKGLDLSTIGIEDHKDFIEAINDISYEYQSLQNNYASEQARQTSNIGKDPSHLPVLSSKEQLAHDLIRDISILHQVQLGQSKLTTVHAEHIEKTVNAEIENMQRFTDSDKEHAANNIYKIINSKQWRKQLEFKNQEYIEHANKKLAAKTIGEYTSLMHETNTKYNHSSGSIADQNQHNQVMAKIKNASDYLADNNIKTKGQLLKLYKTHVTPESIHKALVHECRERNIHVIKHNLDILGKNKIIHIGDKPFTCPKKYLQHVLDHHHNEYMPRNRITKVIEKINHFEKHLEKQHEIYHGPDL